jgi:hypothetical protein
MKFIRNNRWKLVAEVSNEEMEMFDSFKKEMFYVLHDHIENSFLTIENHLSKHILLDAQFDELLSMKNFIVNGNSYNSYYSNVIIMKNQSFKFSNDDLFLRFAHYVNLVDNQDLAVSKLKEYIELQCIEYVLRQYDTGILTEQKIVLKIPKEHYNKEYLYLFKPYGFELFEYLNDNVKEPRGITTKYNALYKFLLDRNFIKNNKKDYSKLIGQRYQSDLGYNNNGEKIRYNKVEFKDNTEKYLNENESHLLDLEKIFRTEKEV